MSLALFGLMVLAGTAGAVVGTIIIRAIRRKTGGRSRRR
jgi:hypothetical protein